MGIEWPWIIIYKFSKMFNNKKHGQQSRLASQYEMFQQDFHLVW